MKFDQHPEQEAIDAKMEELFDKYVPASGCCPTEGGEIVRAMNRVIYRFYNDGDMCKIGYGKETVNPPCRFLASCGLTLRIWEECLSENEYNYQMYEDCKRVLNYLEKHQELFETRNTRDMWACRDPREDIDDWYEDDDEY